MFTYESGVSLLVHHNKDRPSNKEKKKQLECSEIVEEEIQNICKLVRLRKDDNVLLLVSIATDNMIRLIAIHPKLWFMDYIWRTNYNYTDLFIIAIRTPNGETFPDNLTVIPSGKRWIFVCVYQLAFIQLYREITCLCNCLALCDKDNSEYGPFGNCIAAVSYFQKLS